MKHEDADYHHIMKLHGLSDFGAYVTGEWVEPKIIEIERENDYAEHQYLLYLKKKESIKEKMRRLQTTRNSLAPFQKKFGTQKFGFDDVDRKQTMGKSMGGFTSQMTQMSRKRAHSPSKRGPTILDRSDSPSNK